MATDNISKYGFKRNIWCFEIYILLLITNKNIFKTKDLVISIIYPNNHAEADLQPSQ